MLHIGGGPACGGMLVGIQSRALSEVTDFAFLLLKTRLQNMIGEISRRTTLVMVPPVAGCWFESSLGHKRSYRLRFFIIKNQASKYDWRSW